MDTEIKAQWIKALRSGEYVQGRGRLRQKRISDATIEISVTVCFNFLPALI